MFSDLAVEFSTMGRWGMAKRSSDVISSIAWPVTSRDKAVTAGIQSSLAPLLVPLDLIELGALDLWIEDQPGRKLSRTEAARKLINQALSGK
jgi:hypothetical protein